MKAFVPLTRPLVLKALVDQPTGVCIVQYGCACTWLGFGFEFGCEFGSGLGLRFWLGFRFWLGLGF